MFFINLTFHNIFLFQDSGFLILAHPVHADFLDIFFTLYIYYKLFYIRCQVKFHLFSSFVFNAVCNLSYSVLFSYSEIIFSTSLYNDSSPPFKYGNKSLISLK